MHRLKTRPQFQAVLAGNIVAKTAHFALHRHVIHAQALQAGAEKNIAQKTQTPSLFAPETVWVGALVPKRWAKRAVTRNTIKRQIYTVSADFLQNYSEAAFVVRLRTEFSRKEFPSATSGHLKEAVRSEIVALMQAAGCAR